ncbi:hypothetical protein RHMOL_Rhmol10G0126400 [Rhododendron molle]|uniref:Uncharacterized protein n=1 Tax=Rhododendron molle TaxID=49168 RepID=A0ACC0M1F3_RHOML|nr:hypothetical protein RHMOL_Rhmol10G0126400 [Rhododendron molle]
MFCNTKYTKFPRIIIKINNNKQNNDDQQIRAPFDGSPIPMLLYMFLALLALLDYCIFDDFSLLYVKTLLPLLQMPHLDGKGGLVLAEVVNGSPPELASNPNTPTGTTIDALVGISARFEKVGVTRSVTMSHVQ